MDVFVARQPVFDGDFNVVAYELLYRDSLNNFADFSDPDVATMKVLVNAFSEIGLEKISSGHPVLINVTQNIIESGQLPHGLGDLLIPEVLEDVTVTEKGVQAIQHLVDLGYKVALDDFVYRTELKPLIPMADFIKLDVMDLGVQGVKEQLARLRMTGTLKAKLVAEKIETHEEFELYRTMGFDYFQGYFLCKPHVVTGSGVPAMSAVITALLTELSKEDFEIKEVERLICQDPRLSYKLLRVVNSAFFGLNRKIKSIADCVVVLGSEELRRWASMLVCCMVSGKPHELLVTAMIRAKMCEIVAGHLGRRFGGGYFIVGLLSLLDALLNRPLEAIVSEMPLSAELEIALLTGDGDFGQVLKAVEAYELGQFEFLEPLGLDADLYWRAYLKALEWADLATHSMIRRAS